MLEPRRGRRQIDQRAWSVLERCRIKLGLRELPLPIPVDEWIERPLGIRFGFADLARLGPDVLGAAYVKEREIAIDERVLTHQGRFRFTCAHELGHLTLHRKVRSVFQETDVVGTCFSADRYERDADRYAAAFLMPVPLLEHALLHVFDAHGLNRAEALITLMKPTLESEWLWRKRVLPHVTRRFDVSLSAAAIRFSDVQPRIQDSLPLMPAAFSDRLLRPAMDKDKFDSVWVEGGIPVHRDLFTSTEDNVAH
jgi:hypothetical protein